ncbi:MAG: DUF1080 domain-containing protein [Planctomycetaceae bacterium]|nr:DUF1080 domain-containing protein [Planctomycetaceae bacterium]
MKNFCLPVFVICVTVCSWSPTFSAEEKSKEPSPSAPKAENAVKEKKDPQKEGWKPLLNGENLDGWSLPGFGGEGDVQVKKGNLTIGVGILCTGIKYEKEFPKKDYEIRYEAKRTKGYDFFAALTFPVGDSFCTFINGGWGGGVVGLSCLDGADASENSTTQYYSFKEETWYKFRVAVTEDKIKVWIGKEDQDPELKIDQPLEGCKVGTRLEVQIYEPLGLATWCTEGVIRHLEYRLLKPEETAKIKAEIKK